MKLQGTTLKEIAWTCCYLGEKIQSANCLITPIKFCYVYITYSVVTLFLLIFCITCLIIAIVFVLLASTTVFGPLFGILESVANIILFL